MLAFTDGTRHLSTYLDENGGWLGTVSPHKLLFYVNNGAPSLSLDLDGQLGIGTLTPLGSLHVVQGLASVREQVPDPVGIQVEHDGLERWIHARTIARRVRRPGPRPPAYPLPWPCAPGWPDEEDLEGIAGRKLRIARAARPRGGDRRVASRTRGVADMEFDAYVIV